MDSAHLPPLMLDITNLRVTNIIRGTQTCNPTFDTRTQSEFSTPRKQSSTIVADNLGAPRKRSRNSTMKDTVPTAPMYPSDLAFPIILTYDE
jgi:hypothetical protein